MKIFGKRIGNFLSVIFDGKPKQVIPQDDQEMNEYIDLIKKSNTGDKESQNELKEKLFKDEIEIPEIVEIKQNIENTASKLKSIEKELTISQKYDEIKKSDFFEVKIVDNQEKVYLKGFKAELPGIIIDEFVKKIIDNEDVEPLVNFWKANLLNRNKDARRGLYSFIKKQKLIVVDGYFLAVRRVHEVFDKSILNSVINENVNPDFLKIINEFTVKVKRWKKSTRSYEVYWNIKDKVFILKPIKDHEKNKANYNLQFKGVLYDIIEANKVALPITHVGIKDENRIFTDDYTRTVIFQLNKIFRMDRAKCDENPKKECSSGFHVGSPSYVLNNKSLGDTIIAVLINPQHVISVPYRDAHKMRICEGLPVMILSEEQLRNIDSIDFSQHVQTYKKLEQKKLEEALNVIDDLDVKDFQEFSVERKITSQEDLDKIVNELNEKKQLLSKQEMKLKQLLDDDISQSLDVEEVKNIIKSRLS